MNIQAVLEDSFQGNNETQVEEKYSSYKLKYSVKDIHIKEDLLENINSISKEDSFVLSLSIGENEPITLGKESDIKNFINEISEYKNLIEDEYVKLEFEIKKEVKKGTILIYNFDSFCNFISNLDCIDFLDLFSKDLIEYGSLYFRVLDSTDLQFNSNRVNFFSKRNYDNKYPHFENSPSYKNSYFSHYNLYPFRPEDFFLNNRGMHDNIIIQRLDELVIIFCLTHICNFSILENKILSCKVNGFKIVEQEYRLNDLPLDSKNELMQLYSWTYSEKTNMSEKLGIARNIISIFSAQGSINFTNNILASAKSGYQTYLQSNLNRYIEIRNKINDQLIEITGKSNSIIEKYLDNYQKSIFSFVSFFISVFIIRVLITGNFQDVFTKDATTIACGILALSFLYLLFSVVNLIDERQRLKIRYENLKNRFKDLLIPEDIDKILRSDREFNTELKFFDSRMRRYTLLWFLSLCILFIMLCVASQYLNFPFI